MKKAIDIKQPQEGADKSKDLSEKEIEQLLAFTDFCLFTQNTVKESLLYYPNKEEPVFLRDTNIQFFQDFIKAVVEAYNNFNKKEDFVVFFRDRCFRACAMKYTTKGLVFAIRQASVDYKEIKDLKLGEIVIEELLHDRLNQGGLVIIAGSPGNGKTTTSASMIIKRLEEHSGVCITVEDPPEFPISGMHGNGLCIQNTVKNNNFEAAIKTSLRSYPTGQNTIMFVGEVRDAESASEVIKASLDGRLVIVTVHADSVYSGIKRIAGYAFKTMGEEAYSMLAESFRVAIHQKLKTSKNGARMMVECLVNSTACVNIIKKNKIEQLRNEAEMQKSKWNTGQKVVYHKDR